MAVVKVRDLWTTFITAFFALLASIGLTKKHAPAAVLPTARPSALPVLPQQERPDDSAAVIGTRTNTEAARALVPAQRRCWRPAVRERSLPPTIKQRIRAEAHGSSPSVRKLPVLEADSDVATTSGSRLGSLFGLGRARWLSRGADARSAVDTGATPRSTSAAPAPAPSGVGVHPATGVGADAPLTIDATSPAEPSPAVAPSARCGDWLDQNGHRTMDSTHGGTLRPDRVRGIDQCSDRASVRRERVLELDRFRAPNAEAGTDEDDPGTSSVLKAA
ncbi:DUF6344 domain-containing protein [Streptomyces sp. NPDC056500]|uniref:DUF6344 domain-containing protein n=1 Tax=Streptomyces sp. NPDC056500 TaxID=3345840 RepID=UPI00369B719B